MMNIVRWHLGDNIIRSTASCGSLEFCNLPTTRRLSMNECEAARVLSCKSAVCDKNVFSSTVAFLEHNDEFLLR